MEHCSPGLKLTLGVINQTLPELELLSVTLSCWPDGQAMSNHPASSVTGSVKSTSMLASFGALKPSVSGSVDRTDGPISWIGVVRLGDGAPVTKSDPFTLVSIAPPPFLKMAVVLLGDGAFVAPS